MILLPLTLYANEVKDRSEKIIREVCGSDIKINWEKFRIQPEIKSKIESETGQKFFSEYLIVWRIYRNGRLVAFAVLDNVTGKSLPITFLVILDIYGNIVNSSIVKYREPYGGGVSDSRWQKQFEGRSNQSSYIVGKDIQAISGATISVNSITAGIRKLTLLFSYIKNHYEYSALSDR